MYIFDGRITIGDKELLESYLQGYDYKTSGLSFSSMYMWRDINQFSWQVIGDYLCMAGISHLELEEGIILPFLFPPLTRTGSYEPESLRRTILEARRIFESQGHEFSIRLLPFHMIDILKSAFPGELCFSDDRPNYDYVYRTQDLIDLKGREYHSKRNHLNYFLRNYEYEYVRLTPEMAGEAMQFIAEFNRRKHVPDHEMLMLRMEEQAMEDVFRNIDKLGYLAGAIRINGKIEAISIGGMLNSRTVTVHVEKANIEYRGLYQAINNEFCKHVASNIKLINREEDMGIPNLRKAKLSYKPAKLVEKYIVKFKKSICPEDAPMV